MRRFIVPLVLSASLALPSLAWRVRAEDKALAESLFNEGKVLMDAGKIAEACPKLAASLRAERADGTMLRLGLCYQQLGKWASAWALFKEVLPRAEKAGRKDRVDMAKKGIAETEPKLSRVTIKIESAARVAGMEVKWDDTVLEEGAWGTPLTTDPGGHTLSIKAPGKKPYAQHVDIGGVTSDNKTILVQQLEDEPLQKPPTPPVTAVQGSDKGNVVESETPNQRLKGYLAVGLGVVLGGVTIGARFAVKSANDDHFATCAQQTTPNCSDSEGVATVRTWEGISFATGGLALASLGLGIYWIATAPASKPKPQAGWNLAPTIGAKEQMLVLSGRF